MNKSIKKNYIYNLIYQIMVIILPLITTPYVSRILGAENLGIYSYTESITTYFIVFGALGISLYGKREIAFVQNDKKKYSVTFWEIVFCRMSTMLISLLLFYIFFARTGEYSIYYRILIFEMIGNIFDISWFFQGLEDFKRTVLRNLVVKIVSVICIFIFVKTKNDLPLYFIIYVASLFIGNLSLWLYLPKYLVKINKKKINILKHYKPIIGLFIPQIAIQVYTMLDKTMIGAIIADKSEVGCYEQSQKVVNILLTIITSVGTVMLPRIANTFAEGDKNKIKDYMTKSFNMVFILSVPMILGVIIVSKDFVPLFFGQGYDRVSSLMDIISPIILIIGMSNVIGMQYLLPTKRQKEYTISVFSGAIINFIMNIILIPKFGAFGASIGTVMAELSVTVVQMFYTRKDFNYKKILQLSVKYIISGLLMFIACMLINKFIDHTILNMLLQIAVGSIIYFGVLILLKDKFIFDLIKSFKDIVNKKIKEK